MRGQGGLCRAGGDRQAVAVPCQSDGVASTTSMQGMAKQRRLWPTDPAAAVQVNERSRSLQSEDGLIGLWREKC